MAEVTLPKLISNLTARFSSYTWERQQDGRLVCKTHPYTDSTLIEVVLRTNGTRICSACPGNPAGCPAIMLAANRLEIRSDVMADLCHAVFGTNKSNRANWLREQIDLHLL